ncbi:MAG: hypothetical protein ACLTSX_14285 [Collinsella sp.]
MPDVRGGTGSIAVDLGHVRHGPGPHGAAPNAAVRARSWQIRARSAAARAARACRPRLWCVFPAGTHDGDLRPHEGPR